MQRFVLTHVPLEQVDTPNRFACIRAVLDSRFRRPNEARAAAAFERVVGFRRGGSTLEQAIQDFEVLWGKADAAAAWGKAAAWKSIDATKSRRRCMCLYLQYAVGVPRDSLRKVQRHNPAPRGGVLGSPAPFIEISHSPRSSLWNV